MSQLSLIAEPTPWARFSECEEHAGCAIESCAGRPYRYILAWPTGLQNERAVAFVLANPSTASAEQTDPTVARTIDYAKRWGFGWDFVVNTQAWRATDPKDVPAGERAIGPENDHYIAEACKRAEIVVCGWGKLDNGRGAHVLELIRDTGHVPYVLKLNDAGSPTHPLYLSSALRPKPMEAR